MKKRNKKLSKLQKLMLFIIGITFLIVVFALVFHLINTPENRVKKLISELSEEYYETYLYPDFSETENFKNNPTGVMELYKEYGFSSINLRQLLLYDNQKNAKHAEFLGKYCNENQTLIKFFPVEPYGENDYQIKYTYACDF